MLMVVTVFAMLSTLSTLIPNGIKGTGTFIRYSHNSTVTTTSNITYTAYFERNVGISEADGDALFHHVYADGGRIVVAGAEGERVCLYDITGRLLATQQDAGVHGGTPLRFDVPSVGVYLIHIGNAEVRKVAVVR